MTRIRAHTNQIIQSDCAFPKSVPLPQNGSEKGEKLLELEQVYLFFHAKFLSFKPPLGTHTGALERAPP